MTRKIFFTTLAVLLTLGLSMAQIPTGRIVGRVTDAEGAPLPGVSITCDSTRMVGLANAVTDETGTYRLFSLPSGMFSVRFTLPGFKTLTRREIVVQLEQTLTLNVQLEQSALAEEITVVGQSPLIDVKSTTKGSTMTKEVFMQLPRNRSFDGLLSTVPGVQYEPNQGGLSVDGASGTENMWYIDGTNVNGIHVGLRNQSIVMEQLDEVKVTASGYNAEFGGSMGGVVNVISRSGGNTFHGDAFGYYNNNKLWMQGKDRDYLRLDPYAYPYIAEYVNADDLNDFYDGGKNRDDYQRFEGVFNFSGYAVKDVLWFFGSFNPVYGRTYADRWFRSDPVNLSQAKFANDVSHDPRQGRQLYSGFYSESWNYNWQAKLTAAPFKGMRIALSAVSNWSQSRGSIPSLAGTSNQAYSYFPDWQFSPGNTKGKQAGFTYPNMSGAAVIDYTVSNNFLINLRGGYFRTNTTDQQLFVPGTSYSFGRSNMTLFPEIPANLRHDQGWSNGAATTKTQKYIMSKISGNLDFTFYMNLAGEHAWKAGVQYIRLGEDVKSAPESPRVTIYWNDYYDLPDGRRIQGTYGYYTIRGDWVSAYGSIWDIASNNWAIYLQDSWTIGQKLTLNLGVRTESEYIPSLDMFQPDVKPIKFGFDQKLAPRLGIVYDFFGDSSLKIFGSFGVYYDVMKLYMAEGAYGGFLWWSSIYELNDWDFTKIAASGKIDDKESQTVNGINPHRASWNDRTTSWDTTDPNLKPVAQSELSFGAEKKVSEEISFSARLVYKHLLQTIEDVGILEKNEFGGESEQYYIANPGMGWVLPVSKGGKFEDRFWESPKAKREYYGINLALEKRFSNNWQGGINYTWSRMTGNYGGLSSSDEGGRNSPNVERYWDLFYERYDLHGRPLDGVLPSDRTHYIKAYGSYAFPFGVTAGLTAYGRSGLPRSTSILMSRMPIYPENYFDTGQRTPFTLYADMFLEYNLRIAKKYTVSLNATIFNITNTSTILTYVDRPNILRIAITEDVELAKAWNWKDEIATHEPDPQYGKWSTRYGAWSWRMGARFSF